MEKHHYFVQIENTYLPLSYRFHDRIIYCSAHELRTYLDYIKKKYKNGSVIRQIVKLD